MSCVDKLVCDKLVCDKLVCDKEDMTLKRNDDNNAFTLAFTVRNNNISLRNIINFKIYELMFALNKDVIEKIDTINMRDDGSIDVLFIFKRFGSELGMAQKYMLLNTKREELNDEIRIVSESIRHDKGTITDAVSGCEVVTSEYANLSVKLYSEHEADVCYSFHMDLDDDLPTYMENIVGMLMKKIFFRLKSFIEKIQ